MGDGAWRDGRREGLQVGLEKEGGMVVVKEGGWMNEGGEVDRRGRVERQVSYVGGGEGREMEGRVER